jgi:hypothetical protein
MQRISLRDVQGMWGGRNIFLSRDGTLWVQAVARGLQEKRYKLTLSAEAINDLEKFLSEHRVEEIAIKDRPGVPGEGRPTIELTTTEGKVIQKVKWANDKNEQFDTVYKQLILLVPEDGRETPVFSGAFDHNWKPEGF